MVQEEYITELRMRAENILNKQNKQIKHKPVTDQTVYQLLEELTIYQAELEVQNEDLIKTQLELEESNNKYVTLYDFAPIGYFTFDQDGLVVEINQAGLNLLGIQKKDILNRCFSRYIASEFQTLFSQHRQRAFKELSTQSFELKLLRWSGPSFYAQLESKAIMDSRSGKMQLLTFITDISERKLLEETMHQQQIKMAAIDRMRSMNELVSTISHDQNHSLAMINNYIYGSIRRLESGNFNPTDLLQALKQVEKQTRILGEIILRMKNFTSKGVFRYEYANLDAIIKETLCLINYEMLGFFVSITYESSCDLPTVKLDKLHIQQVILNLARNAIEAMRDGHVREPKLVIEANLSTKSENIIEITMRDNGPGFPAEIKDKLFEPHFSTKSYGIGLGLTVSRTIIEKHGGQLTAQLNSLGGACFQFTLPCVAIVKPAHP